MRSGGWRRHVFADGAHAGPKLEAALKRVGRWTFEIVKRPNGAQGVEVLPRRWVVERPLARLDRIEDGEILVTWRMKNDSALWNVKICPHGTLRYGSRSASARAPRQRAGLQPDAAPDARGAASTGGAQALPGRETLAGLGASDNSGALRLELTAGDGMALCWAGASRARRRLAWGAPAAAGATGGSCWGRPAGRRWSSGWRRSGASRPMPTRPSIRSGCG